MDNITKILDFWFGEIKDGFTKENRGKLWYIAQEETDNKIKELFMNLIVKAGNKELDWKQTAKGRLALIILLDQFTRNVYRRTKKAFAYDKYALALCKEGLQLKHDKELCFVHRLFFYHPLQHSENLEDQKLSVKLTEQLKQEVPEQNKKKVESFLKYAKQHHDIIEKFGRFPHRNEVLGRESTEEELKYLKLGKRFGQ
ncbi:DUF924 domain-containing protein [archaeon AH-315-M20]|nr:DUF924 domain-containing protein [archaeon AH-315-M20]